MMALPKSPQLEDGHVRIANELFEAITAHPFKLTTMRVLLAVLRKTYGYSKKEDDLSASQLAALCGKMGRQHVTTALNELSAMNVITKRPGKYGSIVGINKNYRDWLDSPELGQVSESGTSPKSGQVSEISVSASPKLGQVDSPKSGHTTNNLPKDNQQHKSADADSAARSNFARLALVPTPPPVIDLPIKDGSEFEISEDMVAEWSAAYPGIEVRAELLKARVWLRASPQNQKTRRGMGKFIVNWLSNAQTPRQFTNKRPSAHGNFSKRNYSAGVGDDGSF